MNIREFVEAMYYRGTLIGTKDAIQELEYSILQMQKEIELTHELLGKIIRDAENNYMMDDREGA